MVNYSTLSVRLWHPAFYRYTAWHHGGHWVLCTVCSMHEGVAKYLLLGPNTCPGHISQWHESRRKKSITLAARFLHREDDNLKTRGLEKKKEEEKSFFFYKIIKFKVFCVSPTLFKIRTRHLCYHTVQYLKSRLCGSN